MQSLTKVTLSASRMGNTLEVNENMSFCYGSGDMIKAELNQSIPGGNGEGLKR